jgi:hypothetical protein
MSLDSFHRYASEQIGICGSLLQGVQSVGD